MTINHYICYESRNCIDRNRGSDSFTALEHTLHGYLGFHGPGFGSSSPAIASNSKLATNFDGDRF